MLEILLSKHAKMLVSSLPRIGSDIRADGVLSSAVPANSHESYAWRFFFIEVLIPRGARAEYGLLGMEFSSEILDRVDLVVPYSSDLGQIWPRSLAEGIDIVRDGLPMPFAKSVMGALRLYGDGVFPPGKIVIREAAHGEVGSSESLFKRLAEAVIVLLALGNEDVDDNTATNLRAILL